MTTMFRIMTTVFTITTVIFVNTSIVFTLGEYCLIAYVIGK